ncbi:MAG: hypothetical protein ACM31G_00735, partial [Flavobacteriales bacterium]
MKKKKDTFVFCGTKIISLNMHLSFEKNYLLIFCLSIAILFSSCSKSKDDYNFKAVAFTVPTRIPGEADAQTKEMIKHVQHTVSQIDVANVQYILNNKKVDILASQIQNLTGNKRINAMFPYGMELLNAGKTEESIEALNEVLTAIEAANTTSKANKLFIIKKQLAIAYMRKAEQDNCLTNHTNESCIIPISVKAQHILKEGAEKAIHLLNELLNQNPNDLECQYLLNIAHMTIGQYPDKVPEKFRIPETYFSNAPD